MKGNSAKYVANMAFLMNSTPLFVTRTVKSFMGGYEDDLLEMAKMMIPEKIKSNVFSLMMGVRYLLEMIKYKWDFEILSFVEKWNRT